MLICIKAGAKDPMWRLPIPFFFFINLLVREKFITMLVEKSKQNEADKETKESIALKEMLQNIDYAELRQALGSLRKYRGLKLVDIKSSNGEIVRIII